MHFLWLFSSHGVSQLCILLDNHRVSEPKHLAVCLKYQKSMAVSIIGNICDTRRCHKPGNCYEERNLVVNGDGNGRQRVGNADATSTTKPVLSWKEDC